MLIRHLYDVSVLSYGYNSDFQLVHDLDLSPFIAKFGGFGQNQLHWSCVKIRDICATIDGVIDLVKYKKNTKIAFMKQHKLIHAGIKNIYQL